jgi:hypothetical protein
VRKVQKTNIYFLPFYLVLAGCLFCINLQAQEHHGDTLKPIPNFRRWYQNFLPTPYDGPKNKLQMPMAVGYTDFDNNIRDLQLLGKLQPEQSLTIRPYILTPKLGYDSLLAMIDPEFENHGHLVERKHSDIQLLPINFLQKYNSHHPYGWNDGPLSFSKGYQFVGSGGVYMRWRNIHLNLRPEFFKTASDPYETSPDWGFRTSALNKLTLGQSSLRIDFGPLSFGVSTQNLWLGPGQFSSLLMSNNAPGFKHYSFRTNRPLKTFLGNFDLSIIGGFLNSDSAQSFENKALAFPGYSKSTRYINTLTLTYTPFFFKNMYLGANRVFHQFSLIDKSNNFIQDYLPVFNSLFRNEYRDDGVPVDQLISGFVKFVFPNEHAEIYYEYGWNDGSSNLRDLTLEVAHSAASIFGIKKLQYINSNTYLLLEAEATKMAQSPGFLLRNANNWYVHGLLKDGYTNGNQIIGAGSGMGNNLQSFMISLNKGWNKYGIKFQHISQDPMRIVNNNWEKLYLGDVYWNDFCYGILLKQKFNKLLFNVNVDWVYSKNYLWKENHKATNLYVFLNTIYLW